VSSTLHKYHLALDTEERFLYMSDPANYRIIRIPLNNLKAAKRLLIFLGNEMIFSIRNWKIKN
jgi:hypothetical protein